LPSPGSCRRRDTLPRNSGEDWQLLPEVVTLPDVRAAAGIRIRADEQADDRADFVILKTRREDIGRAVRERILYEIASMTSET
jgi:hypothetical protein